MRWCRRGATRYQAGTTDECPASAVVPEDRRTSTGPAVLKPLTIIQIPSANSQTAMGSPRTKDSAEICPLVPNRVAALEASSSGTPINATIGRMPGHEPGPVQDRCQEQCVEGRDDAGAEEERHVPHRDQ